MERGEEVARKSRRDPELFTKELSVNDSETANWESLVSCRRRSQNSRKTALCPLIAGEDVSRSRLGDGRNEEKR